MTGDVVNLNKARKAKARLDTQAGAKTNRMKFGRAKAETIVQKLQTARETRALDQHRIERDKPETV